MSEKGIYKCKKINKAGEIKTYTYDYKKYNKTLNYKTAICIVCDCRMNFYKRKRHASSKKHLRNVERKKKF